MLPRRMNGLYSQIIKIVTEWRKFVGKELSKREVCLI